MIISDQWSRGSPSDVFSMCQKRSAHLQANMKNVTTELTTPMVKLPRVNESRKIRKPLMEKRRRARINDCLNELKRMLLDADTELKKSGSRPTKLEKADILELTVRHVRKLQKESRFSDKSSTIDLKSMDGGEKFKAGFRECAREVRNELDRLELGDEALRERLGVHLTSCLNNIQTPEVQEVSSSCNSPPPPRAVLQKGSKGYTLIPTKLPNGDIAFVIPAQLRGKCVSNIQVPRIKSQEPVIGPVWRPW